MSGSEFARLPPTGEGELLTEILEQDDPVKLENRLKLIPGLASTFAPRFLFHGKRCSMGIIAAAIHCKALNCLNVIDFTPETFGGKRKGPSALHIACDEGWVPGIRLLLEHRVPFQVFDCFQKSPLAYVADNKNMTVFKLVLKHIADTGEKSALKNVYLTNQGSIDFLRYCVDSGNDVMIEACCWAHDIGLLSDDDVAAASCHWTEKWGSEREKPMFLELFTHTRSLKIASDQMELFTPYVAESRFALIETVNGVMPRDAIRAIDEIYAGVKREENWLLVPSEFSASSSASILLEFPRHLLQGKNILYDCTQYYTLKQYFETLVSCVMVDDGNFWKPLAVSANSDTIWQGFGVVLAHLGLVGCHYRCTKPLHPLLYVCLCSTNPLNMGWDSSQIEEFMIVTNQEAVRNARTAGMIKFLNGDDDHLNEWEHAYDSEIIKPWSQEQMYMRSICEYVREGFYGLKMGHYQAHLQDFVLMDAFRKNIQQSSATTVRLWFEGIQHLSGDDLLSPIGFLGNMKFTAYTTCDPETRMDVEEIERFKNLFIQWCKKAKHSRDFLSALCGTSLFLPISTTSHNIVFIGERSRRVKVPIILLPRLSHVLFVMNSEEELDQLADDIISTRKLIEFDMDCNDYDFFRGRYVRVPISSL